MRRETTDLIGSGLLLAALVLATFGALAPSQGASASVAASPIVTTSSAIERGRFLFNVKGCTTCHVKSGEHRPGPNFGPTGVGPELSALAQRAGERRPGMSAQAYVRESLKTPSAFKAPGYENVTFGMPDLGLSDAEIEVLTTFLLETTQ